MDTSLYTLKYFTKTHVYYLIFHNDFLNNFLIIN